MAEKWKGSTKPAPAPAEVFRKFRRVTFEDKETSPSK